MKEIFKDIPGYKGYQISNLGRVKSLVKDRNNCRKEKILKLGIDHKGYYHVTLCKNNKGKTMKVHRLVLVVFKGFSNLHCNHIDCNKLNNKIKNLEYVTNLENMRHARKRGLYKDEKMVDQYDLDGNFIRSFNSMADAGRELNIGDSHIATCCKGKQKTVGGFQWRYFKTEIKKNIGSIQKNYTNAHFKKKIDQYDLNGNFIKSFNSIMGAEKKLNIANSSISQCCSNKQKTAGGFQWRYHTGKIIKINVVKSQEKKVDQFTVEGIFIKSFDSMSAAERELNIDHSHISACCKGKHKTIGGYIWKYYKEGECYV